MTAHSLQLWVPAVADGRFGSSVASPASSEKQGGTEGRSKVAVKYTDQRLNLAEARAVLRAHAKSVIFAAFPDRSQRAICIKAAHQLGVSPDTINRLIEGETVNPCSLILGHCAAIVRRKTGKPTPICRVLGQIFAAEIAP